MAKASTGIEAITGAPARGDESDALAKEQIKRHSDLMAKYKAVFSDDHQTISQYFLPQDSDINVEKTEGIASWTQQIFDTTAIQAAQVLQSGLFNWWTPPNQPWTEYEPPEELKQSDDIGDATNWLGTASDKFLREIGRSNFYPVKAMGDLGLGVFGTDTIIFDQSDEGEEIFNFIHCKIGTYTIEENYKGIVDTLRREFKMTYRQMKQKFSGRGDFIPTKISDQCRGDTGMAKEFRILHCIFPRDDSKRLKGAKDGPNKPVASVYIAMDFQCTIRESGYDETPILCRRFAKWGTGAAWGYGPAYLAIPDARQVNYVQQYLDALAELHAYPRILVPNELEGDVDLRAGGTTPKGSNPEDKPEEWATVGDYKLGMEMQEQRRQAIRDAFYNDAFKLLNSQPLLDKEMTAYEISQRQAEQMQSIAALNSRQIPEFHNPLGYRGFGIMLRSGKLGTPPKALQQDLGDGKSAIVRPDVLVTSRFNDALKALKNRGTEATLQFLAPIAEAHPELGIYDNFVMDDVAVETGRNNGMAADLFRKKTGENSVAAIRSARMKMQQQQRAAAMAEQVSKAGKNLGSAPPFMQEQAEQALTGGKDKKRAA